MEAIFLPPWQLLPLLPMSICCFFQFSMSCSTRVLGCELTLAMLGGRSLGSAEQGCVAA